jgi:hypothetical protein
MRTTPPPLIDIAQIFPELADKAKTTVRLHPRRGPEPGSRESKMGGLFLWPADEPWPVCDVPEGSYELGIQEIIDINHPEHNDYYTTVLQLRKDDFPELQFPGDTNLFQLLWCPRDHDDPKTVYGLILKHYWRKEEDITNPIAQVPTPKKPYEWCVLISCVLHPERLTEYPILRELPEDLASEIYEWEDEGDEEYLYDEQFSVAQGMKLGGYVAWIQNPETPNCENGHQMEHLLTIASSEYEGGKINESRWVPLEDRNNSTDEDQFIEEPTGIMLGDDGSIYVFICRECNDWPIKWVYQCY